jgi:hypothetical protein
MRAETDQGLEHIAYEPTMDSFIIPITAASWAAGIVTVMANNPYNQIHAGKEVMISEMTPPGYNGPWVVATADPTQFTFPMTYNPGTPATGFGQVMYYVSSKRLRESLEMLNLQGTRVTDEGMHTIDHCVGLRNLKLAFCEITDKGLEWLSGLHAMQYLDLTATHVTDAGMKYLAMMENLYWLELASTKVTDVGLLELRACQRLSYIDLSNTRVTENGIRMLRNALPELHVWKMEYRMGRRI